MRKSTQTHLANSVGTMANNFGCTVMELRHLMELRTSEAVAEINQRFGGVQGLCEKLKTSNTEGEALPPASVSPAASWACGKGQM